MAALRWLDRTLSVSNVYLALCLDEELFYRELVRMGVKPNSAPEWIPKSGHACCHFLEHKGREVCIVCIRPEKRPIEDIYGLLVHEAVHIWQRAAELMGEKEPASEQEAYAVQHISLQLMWSYRGQTKRKRST